MDEDVDDEMIRDVVDVIENDKGLDSMEMNNRSGAMAMEESKE